MSELKRIIDTWLNRACEMGLHEKTKMEVIKKIESGYNNVDRVCLNCGNVMEFDKISSSGIDFVCKVCSCGEGYYNFMG